MGSQGSRRCEPLCCFHTTSRTRLTSLDVNPTGLILLYEALHLLGFGWREEDVIEARVSLLLVDELCQVLFGHVGLCF